MKKIKQGLATFAIGTSVLLGAQEYTSPCYTVKLFDNYLKDNGLNQVVLKGKKVINRNVRMSA